jgi:hypothetical protein
MCIKFYGIIGNNQTNLKENKRKEASNTHT